MPGRNWTRKSIEEMIDAYLRKRLKGGVSGGQIQLPGCTITIRPFSGAGPTTPTSYIININTRSPYEENTSPKFIYYAYEIKDGPTSYHTEYKYMKDINWFNTFYPDFAKKFNKLMNNVSFDGGALGDNITRTGNTDFRFLAMIDGASNLDTSKHFQRYWDYVVHGDSGDPEVIYGSTHALSYARGQSFAPILGMRPNVSGGSRWNPTKQTVEFNTLDHLSFKQKTATFMGIIGASSSDYMDDKIYRLRCYDQYGQLQRIGIGHLSPLSVRSNPWKTINTTTQGLTYYTSIVEPSPSTVNIQNDSLRMLMESSYMNVYYGGYAKKASPDSEPYPKYRRQVMYLTGVELADFSASDSYDQDDDFISKANEDFTIDLFNVLMSWLYVGLIGDHTRPKMAQRPKNIIETKTIVAGDLMEPL